MMVVLSNHQAKDLGILETPRVQFFNVTSASLNLSTQASI